MQDLRVYVDSHRRLWFTTLEAPAAVTSLTLPELLAERQPKGVYVYGSSSQAALICTAMQSPYPVLIGSPSGVRSCRSPSQALQKMSLLGGLPPYFGGWRLAGELEGRVYHFLREHHQDPESRAAIEAYAQHPAAGVLGFFRGGEAAAQRALAYALEDPRWFHRDVNHPERESKLRMFFGLTPRNVEMLEQGKEPNGYNHQRCWLLYRSIYGASTKFASLQGPHFFPSLYYRQRLQLSNHTMPLARAMFLALELAVSYIRQAWLHELAPAGRCLFVPRYFFSPLGFSASSVARAYEAHRKACPSARAGSPEPG